MPTENWYYIRLSNQKPFHTAWEEDGLKVFIPEPDNARKPGDILAIEAIPDSGPERENYPVPLLTKPSTPIEYDEVSVLHKSHAKDFRAKVFGFAGFFRNRLTVIPPVIVNRDKTLAWLYLSKVHTERLPSAEDVFSVIKAEHLMPVIPGSEIEEQIALVREGKKDRILISRGRSARDGWPDYVKSDIKSEMKAGKILEDGRIDFKERQAIREVQKGERIGVYVEAQTKVDGFDVYGGEIPGEFKVLGPKMGANLERNPEDTSVVISKVNGYFSEKPKEINVIETLVINQDVDYSIGNIDFFGNIEIKGTVQPGFSISSLGTVTVSGVVDGASVFAAGPVILRNGVIGRENSRIESRSSITTLYARNAYLKADGDIIVQDFSFNSQLVSNGNIIIQEKKGIMVGGRASGFHSVSVKVAGNQDGAVTVLSAGTDIHHEEKLDTLRKEKENLLVRRETITAKVSQAFSPLFLRNPKAFLEKMKGGKKETALRVLQELTRLNTYIQQLEEKIHKLETKGPDIDFTPIVTISQKKFDGVKVEFPFGGRETSV